QTIEKQRARLREPEDDRPLVRRLDRLDDARAAVVGAFAGHEPAPALPARGRIEVALEAPAYFPRGHGPAIVEQEPLAEGDHPGAAGVAHLPRSEERRFDLEVLAI